MKYLYLLITSLTFSSCKPVVNSIYGVNKNINFKSLQDYKSYVQKKYRIDTNNLFYIGQNSYNDFLNLIINSKTDYFLGIFLNDSIQLKKSEFLAQNESCAGRVLKEIQNTPDEINKILRVKNEALKTHSFINITNNTPFHFSEDGRKKIVLIFSYKAGLINKSDFIQIQNLLPSIKDYELNIISLDKLYDLN